MSHYTTIRTKYNNKKIFKKVLNSLNYPYTQHKEDKKDELIEIFIPRQNRTNQTTSIDYSYNSLTFSWNNGSYIMITDPQSWTKKNSVALFLKKLQLNYSYSETINQALKVGFQHSRIKDNNTRVIFKRYVEVKSFL